MHTTDPTYYDILQVARDAPAEHIRGAYRRMAQRYHPDKSPDNRYAPRVMANLNKAYEILSDPAQRQAHDQWIRRKEARSQTPTIAGRTRPADLYPEEFISRWPWYLLFATITCAVLAIGTVVYRSSLPGRVISNSVNTPLQNPTAHAGTRTERSVTSGDKKAKP